MSGHGKNWGASLPPCFLLKKQSRCEAHTARYTGKSQFLYFGLDCPWLGDAWSGVSDGPFCRGMLKELLTLPVTLWGYWGSSAAALILGMAFPLRDCLERDTLYSMPLPGCAHAYGTVGTPEKKKKAVQKILLSRPICCTDCIIV